MADTSSSSVPLFSLLLLLIVFLSNAKQVSAAISLSDREAIYIIGAIFLVFLVLDIFLVVLLGAWCRHTRRKRHAQKNRLKIRQRSIECLDAGVTLQVKRNLNSPSSDPCQETSFDYNTRGGSVPREADISKETLPANGTDELEMVIEEENHANMSFEERKKSAQMKRVESRRPSETPLLASESTVDDSLKGVSAIPVIEETDNPDLSDLPSFHKEKPAKLVRLESSDYRRDPSAPLLDNEINVNGISPKTPSPETFEVDSKLMEPDTKLVSITSGITGAIVPPDSPPPPVPREIQSLDVSVTAGGTPDGDSSFFTGDNLNVTSSSSIGMSSVFKLVREIEADVADMREHSSHGGQLAPEAMRLHNVSASNTSIVSTGSIPPPPVAEVTTSFMSASYPAGNHERATSFDSSFSHSVASRHENSYPPYYTPQHHIIPRPSPRPSPGRTSSLSLTSSPIHRPKGNS